MLSTVATARIPLPAREVDVAGWLFGLSDGEYAATAAAHLGAGAYESGGRRGLFDAEAFPGVLVVNHHVEEEARRDYVRVRSRGSVAWLLGAVRVPLEVCFELLVRPRGAASELECRLHLGLPRGLEPLARVLGARALQREHTVEQTQGFAADIARKHGAERIVELSAGPVRVRETGSGEPIVFLHGVLMNGATWDEAVPLLADRFRCIAPDLPTGGHRVALRRDARVDVPMLAGLVVELLDALGLERATFVGIGLGTVLCEMLAIDHPERVERVVFASGDILSTFPPPWAKARFTLAYAPPLAALGARLLRLPAARRRAYGLFTRRPDTPITEGYTRGVRGDRGVRRDTLKLLRAIRGGRTGVAHERLREYGGPALALWGADDVAFPPSHPDDLAALLPQLRIERVAGAMTFVAQDRPQAFAAELARFMEETPSPPRPSAAG